MKYGTKTRYKTKGLSSALKLVGVTSRKGYGFVKNHKAGGELCGFTAGAKGNLWR